MLMSSPKQRYPIAALTLPIIVGSPQVIIPAGTFDAHNGALQGSGPWTLNDEDGKTLVNKANSSIDIVVDYEHQTMMAAQNGHRAPAAGWLVAGGLEWQPNVGVVATEIRWTEDAADMIKDGEYRFLSPVFEYSDTGVPLSLLSVGLTNTPALTQLQELAIAAAYRGTTLVENENKQIPTQQTDTQVTAVSAQTAAPVTQSVTAGSPSPTLSVAVASAAPGATVPAQHPMIAALTNQVSALSMDNAKLRAELANMQQQLSSSAKEGIITTALSDGRLVPAMETWARALPMDDLSRYLATAQPIAALAGTQTRGVPPKNVTEPTGLNSDELAICKSLNISHEKFIANRKKLQEQN